MSYKKHLVKQHDMTDCAAACLATICMYYKKETTITRLRDVLGTDIKGTTLNGLEDGARALGFDTKAIRVDKDAFKSKYTLPAIAHVITEEGLSHFVVIHKIKKDKVTILDPAKGVEKKGIDEFFKSFDGILLLMVPENKVLKLNTVLIREIIENEFMEIDKIAYMMESYIKSKGNSILGPMINYSTAGADESGQVKIIFKIMFQLKNPIHNVETPYELKNQIRVTNCLFARFSEKEENLQFAYSKLQLYAFENDIKLKGDSYTVFVENKDSKMIADVFMEIDEGNIERLEKWSETTTELSEKVRIPKLAKEGVH